MKYKELTPNEFLALNAALNDFDFEEQARDFMEEGQEYDDYRGRTFQRLAEGCQGMAALKEHLQKVDGPPIILFRLPEVDDD